jgi:ABC-type Fe3+-hydroxamate transport system substrate-binding protein
MALGWSRLVACLAGTSLLVGACSSSSGGPPPRQSSATSSRTATSPAGSTAQTYLDAVNRLCDALLPKVIAVTHGGSLDIPVRKYLAQQHAHEKLLAAFDRKLRNVPVPPAAKTKATVLQTYIRFADRLDAKRLAAARRGAAAYAKEVRSEASIESDPAITGLTAAGFHQSCEAR